MDFPEFEDLEWELAALEEEEAQMPSEAPVLHSASIDKTRLILMFFACLNFFGFPFIIGQYVQALCGFVAPAFFVISGYLVLREDGDRPQRILRTIKTTAVTFGILAGVYFIANVLIGLGTDPERFICLAEPKTWLDFLLFNIWPLPIGTQIWYLQAILYAYGILYLLDRWELLRFDWIIALVCLGISVITGELSAAFGFELFGYGHISGNFLTRALPYLLIGGLISRKKSVFERFHPTTYLAGAVFGLILSLLEMVLLENLSVMPYWGHMIGMALLAPCVCMLAFLIPDSGFFAPFMEDFSGYGTKFIYFVCPIIHGVLQIVLETLEENIAAQLRGWCGIITFLVSMVLVTIGGRIAFALHPPRDEFDLLAEEELLRETEDESAF